MAGYCCDGVEQRGGALLGDRINCREHSSWKLYGNLVVIVGCGDFIIHVFAHGFLKRVITFLSESSDKGFLSLGEACFNFFFSGETLYLFSGLFRTARIE